MSVILGNDLLVLVNGNAVAGSNSCTVNSSIELKEVSSITSPVGRTWVAGRSQWRVSTDVLVSNGHLSGLLDIGTTYTLRFVTRDGTTGVTGSAILTECEIRATRGNISTGVFVFTGTGDLSSYSNH